MCFNWKAESWKWCTDYIWLFKDSFDNVGFSAISLPSQFVMQKLVRSIDIDEADGIL